MQSKKPLNNLIPAVMLMFCAAVSSYASVTDADIWQNFGNQTLYFLGSDRCPAPAWLEHQQQVVNAFAKPDLQESVLAIESFLEQSLEDYEQDSLARQGRIILDINPRCIFGLYLADKFPGTKLANTGKRQFKQSIEHSCLVTFGTETSWRRLLERELTKTDKDSMNGFKPEFFDESEVPFLLIYLVENGSCKAVQRRARKQLAHYLEKQYGLEPALRQYRILLEEGYTIIDESTKLEVAQRLEQTGAIWDAQQLYGKILQNTDSRETATAAAENLAQIKIANSWQMHAWQTLDVLHKRFPDTELASEDLKSFFLNFQTNREERLKQLISELLATQKEEEVLKLCRACSCLWTKEETPSWWQHVIDSTEPDSLVWQFGRLNLARSLAARERVNEAKDILDGLSSSSYPTIQARALLVSADMVQKTDDRASDTVALYQQAAQMERPTSLPQWFKDFRIKEMDVEKLTAEELGFFASFLRGYNEMVDGNFEIGAEYLLEAKNIISRSLQKSLDCNVQKTTLAMLMLAYLQMGDYARAEQYGLQVMMALEENDKDNRQFPTSPSRIERVDDSLFALFGELRTLQKTGLKLQIAGYASNVYTAVTTQSQPDTPTDPVKSGLIQLFWQIKKRRVKRLLFAEYDLAKTQLTRTGNFKELVNLEPIIFVSQLIGKDSLEQICTVLAAATPREYAKGQMYRFAQFTQQIEQPYMTRMALNIAVQQIDGVPGNVQLLENIADMYLTGNSHQKAIEIYERIVEQVSGSNEAENAQLKIIKVYAEQLKLYDKAIHECQRFLKKFAGSPQINQVEFLVGKLAYLAKDYAGATGQLDSFQRKYPDSPQIGEAMMLAALGRMSEGNSQDAIDRFLEIIQKYPQSDLATRSKFLIGYAQVSEQKYSQALETFRQLIEQFPRSKYTEQAQSFIDRLSKVSK